MENGNGGGAVQSSTANGGRSWRRQGQSGDAGQDLRAVPDLTGAEDAGNHADFLADYEDSGVG